MVDIVDAYHKWVSTDPSLPKLYIDGDPGFFSAGIRKGLERGQWPNLKVSKAAGLHYLQEDSPDTIGQAITDFLTDNVFLKSK